MTAVGWLVQQLSKEWELEDRDLYLIEQAKEKEQQNIIKHSVELCKILISNPIEKSGKTPQELVDSYFSNIFKSE